MADFHLTITADERNFLARLLESASKGDKIEMQHTDTRSYREQIKEEIALVESLISKLKKPA